MVVVADRGGGVAADVSGLIGREDHRFGGLDPAVADPLAVDIEGDGAALAQAAAVVDELGPDLVLAGRDRLLVVDLEALEAEQVVAVGRPAAVDGIQAPAAEGAAPE